MQLPYAPGTDTTLYPILVKAEVGGRQLIVQTHSKLVLIKTFPPDLYYSLPTFISFLFILFHFDFYFDLI